MNRLRVITVLYLLGATGFCQTADEGRTTIFTTPPNKQASCPLEIKATWRGSFVTKPQPVDSSVRQPRSLEITLRNSQSSAVNVRLPPALRANRVPACASSVIATHACSVSALEMPQ